jgi:N-acetylmuramoyl-L-alanine amidase
MLFLLNLWKAKLPFFTSVITVVSFGCGNSDSKLNEYRSTNISVDTVVTTNNVKLALTKEYCQRYYGYNSYKLVSPQIIVVHFTAIPTLKETLLLFKNDKLAPNRKFINKFSLLNVGIHYVVARDGSIYNLTPDSIITRHLIGFNHISIGIENVAKNEDQLTPMQIESNAKLISFLSTKYPSINYLIGHDEYNDKSLPHFKLFKSLDKNYQPYDKPDPGAGFMYQLRLNLLTNYELEFQK